MATCKVKGDRVGVARHIFCERMLAVLGGAQAPDPVIYPATD
ncbi:hypothetical protein [Nocardia sputi]|nr:hypothetical protein [Nocardia sputi]